MDIALASNSNVKFQKQRREKKLLIFNNKLSYTHNPNFFGSAKSNFETNEMHAPNIG